MWEGKKKYCSKKKSETYQEETNPQEAWEEEQWWNRDYGTEEADIEPPWPNAPPKPPPAPNLRTLIGDDRDLNRGRYPKGVELREAPTRSPPKPPPPPFPPVPPVITSTASVSWTDTAKSGTPYPSSGSWYQDRSTGRWYRGEEGYEEPEENPFEGIDDDTHPDAYYDPSWENYKKDKDRDKK